MKIFLGLLLIILVFGCSTTGIKISSKILVDTQETVVKTAKQADKLCDKKIFSKEKCKKISNLYDKTKDTYTKAIEAQLIFIEGKEKYPNSKRLKYIKKFLFLSDKLIGVVNESRNLKTSNSSN